MIGSSRRQACVATRQSASGPPPTRPSVTGWCCRQASFLTEITELAPRATEDNPIARQAKRFASVLSGPQCELGDLREETYSLTADRNCANDPSHRPTAAPDRVALTQHAPDDSSPPRRRPPPR